MKIATLVFLKIDNIVLKYSPRFEWLSYLLMSVLLLSILATASEYINVGIIGNTKGYPWGWQGAPNYDSPEVYAKSMLSEVLWSLSLLVITFFFLKTKRSLYAIAIYALIILSSYGAALYAFSSGSMCGNRLASSILSPDRTNKVVIFERSCGATTDFSTQVSLIRAGDSLRGDGGNIFIADSDHGKVTSYSPIGGPRVEASWKDETHLEIQYSPGSRIFLKNSTLNGIQIMYKEGAWSPKINLQPTTTPPQRIGHRIDSTTSPYSY